MRTKKSQMKKRNKVKKRSKKRTTSQKKIKREKMAAHINSMSNIWLVCTRH